MLLKWMLLVCAVPLQAQAFCSVSLCCAAGTGFLSFLATCQSRIPFFLFPPHFSLLPPSLSSFLLPFLSSLTF